MQIDDTEFLEREKNLWKVRWTALETHTIEMTSFERQVNKKLFNIVASQKVFFPKLKWMENQFSSSGKKSQVKKELKKNHFVK